MVIPEAFPFVLSVNEGGTVGVYPQLTRSDTFTTQEAYDLVGVHITATISNPSAPIPMGIFVAVERDSPNLAVSVASRIVAQLTSGGGNIINRSIWVGFGDFYIPIPSGSPLSLYSCGGVLNPGQPLIGAAVLYLVRQKDRRP